MTDGAIEPVRPIAPGGAVRWTAAHGWTALAAASLGVAAGLAGFSVYAVYRLHVVLPIWDAWATVADAKLVRQGAYGLRELTRQHNEHRLLFPRLLFLVDRALFAMSDRDLLAEIFALQAVTAAVVVRLGWRLHPDRRCGAILAGFVVVVLFSLDQEQNFTSGFQVQFVGVFTAAVLGTAAYASGLDRLGAKALGGVPRPGGGIRLALAGTACFVATYTMANGVLLGVSLLVLAVLVRAPWRATLATLVVSVVLAAAFFHDYDPGPQSGSLAGILADPLSYAAFVAAYVGNPAGTDVRVALVFGGAGMAGLGVAAWRIARGRLRSAAAAALVGIMGFIVASACATAFGRAQFGAVDAFETRYVTPAAVFWCAFVAFWFAELARAPIRAAARAGLAVIAALMLWLAANAVLQEAAAWPFMLDQTIAIRRFRDSLWSGLYDRDASSYENNADTDLRPLLPFLASERLSLFAASEPRKRGLPVASLGVTAPDGTCTGTVAARSDPSLGPDGVRMTGTAWDRDGDRPIRRILTIGPDGTVSGFGSPDQPVGRPRGWTAYATATAGRVVEADALLRDGRVCRLGTAEVAAP